MSGRYPDRLRSERSIDSQLFTGVQYQELRRFICLFLEESIFCNAHRWVCCYREAHMRRGLVFFTRESHNLIFTTTREIYVEIRAIYMVYIAM